MGCGRLRPRLGRTRRAGATVPSGPGARSDEKAGNGKAIGSAIGRASAKSGSGAGSSVMSSGCFVATGDSAVAERRFPQRVLATFLPSVMTVSPFKSLKSLMGPIDTVVEPVGNVHFFDRLPAVQHGSGLHRNQHSARRRSDRAPARCAILARFPLRLESPNREREFGNLLEYQNGNQSGSRQRVPRKVSPRLTLIRSRSCFALFRWVTTAPQNVTENRHMSETRYTQPTKLPRLVNQYPRFR